MRRVPPRPWRGGAGLAGQSCVQSPVTRAGLPRDRSAWGVRQGPECACVQSLRRWGLHSIGAAPPRRMISNKPT